MSKPLYMVTLYLIKGVPMWVIPFLMRHCGDILLSVPLVLVKTGLQAYWTTFIVHLWRAIILLHSSCIPHKWCEHRGSKTIDEHHTKIIQSCYNNCITKHRLLEISRFFRWSVRQWLPVRLLCQIINASQTRKGCPENVREGEKWGWRTDASTGTLSLSVFTSLKLANYNSTTSEIRSTERITTSKLFDVLHSVHWIPYPHF